MEKLFQQFKDKKLKLYGNIQGLDIKQKIHIQLNRIVSFSLTLKNVSGNLKIFNYSYPNIAIQTKPNAIYLIPKSPLIYSQKNGQYCYNYNSVLPFPFISLKYPDENQCLMILTKDKKGRYREIRFTKENDKIKYSNVHYELKLGPNEQIELPMLIVALYEAKNNFIYETIFLYKNLIESGQASQQQIKKNSKLQSNLRRSFFMRVIQLYQVQWHEKHRRINQKSQISLVKMVQKDEQRVGPIAFVHLRDWSCNSRKIQQKFGNYLKQNMVGEMIKKQWLKSQIRQLRKMHNIGVGLYFEGYLVSKSLFQEFPHISNQLEQMSMRNSQNQLYNVWGSSNYHMCPSSIEWRQLISKAIQKVVNYLEVDSIYVDKFGFGSRTSPYKLCTSQNHNHTQFDLQVGQYETLQDIKQRISSKGVDIYIEEVPNDATIRIIEGSLSSALKNDRIFEDSIPLLYARFLNPNLKIYELLTEYTMCKQDILPNQRTKIHDVSKLLLKIKVAFWNGNGIYLPKNLQLYDQKILDLLKKCNLLFTLYNDYFSSLKVKPLIFYQAQKGTQQILVNEFQNEFGNKLLTLLNWDNEEIQLNFRNGKLGGKQLAVIVNGQIIII